MPFAAMRMTLMALKRTFRDCALTSAVGVKPDMRKRAVMSLNDPKRASTADAFLSTLALGPT